MANIGTITDYNGDTMYPKTVSNAVYNEDGTTVSSEVNSLKQGKADKDSPDLTGTPTAPTAPAGTNTDQIATTKFVQEAVNGNFHIGSTKPAKACIWFDTSVGQ